MGVETHLKNLVFQQREKKPFFKKLLSFPIEKIALAAVFISYSAPLFSEATACLLCKIQRYGWLLVFLLAIGGRLLGRDFVWTCRLALAVVFLVAVGQMLIHLGTIPDLCHAPTGTFSSQEDYLTYLTSGRACSKTVLKIMGIPAYVLSLLGAVAALAFSFFKEQKNNKEFL